MAFTNHPQPGDLLRSVLAEMDLSIENFSARSGIAPLTCKHLLENTERIDSERALAIANALGTTPELWTNIQYSCDLMSRRKTLLPLLEQNQVISTRLQALTNLMRIATLEGPGTGECFGVWFDLGDRVHQIAELFTNLDQKTQRELCPVFNQIFPSSDPLRGNAAVRILRQARAMAEGEQQAIYTNAIYALELRLDSD